MTTKQGVELVAKNRWSLHLRTDLDKRLYEESNKKIRDFFNEKNIKLQDDMTYNRDIFKIELKNVVPFPVDNSKIMASLIRVQESGVYPLIEIKYIDKEKGYGVFASIDYPKFTLLGFYAGDLIPFETVEPDNTYDGFFALNDVYTPGIYKNKFPEIPIYSNSMVVVVDNRNGRNWTYFMNGAFTKEEIKKTNVVAVETRFGAVPFIMFVTIQDVKAGDELIYNYGAVYLYHELGKSNEYSTFYHDIKAKKEMKNKDIDVIDLTNDVVMFDNSNENNGLDFRRKILKERSDNNKITELRERLNEQKEIRRQIQIKHKEFMQSQKDKKLKEKEEKEYARNLERIQKEKLKNEKKLAALEKKKEKELNRKNKQAEKKGRNPKKKKDTITRKKLAEDFFGVEEAKNIELAGSGIKRGPNKKERISKIVEDFSSVEDTPIIKRNKIVEDFSSVEEEPIIKRSKNIEKFEKVEKPLKRNKIVEDFSSVENTPIRKNNQIKESLPSSMMSNSDITDINKLRSVENESINDDNRMEIEVEEFKRSKYEKSDNLLFLNEVNLGLTQEQLGQVALSVTTYFWDLLQDYILSYKVLFKYNLTQETKYNKINKKNVSTFEEAADKIVRYTKIQKRSLLEEPYLLAKEEISELLNDDDFFTDVSVLRSIKSYMVSLLNEEDFPPFLVIIGFTIKSYFITFVTTIYKGTLLGFIGGQVRYIYPNINKPFVYLGKHKDREVIVDMSIYANYTVLFRQAKFDPVTYDLLEEPNVFVQIIVNPKNLDLYLTVWSKEDIAKGTEIVIDWGYQYRKAITYYKSISEESVESKIARAVPVAVKKKDGTVVEAKDKFLKSNEIEIKKYPDKAYEKIKKRNELINEQGLFRSIQMQQPAQREIEEKVLKEIRDEKENFKKPRPVRKLGKRPASNGIVVKSAEPVNNENVVRMEEDEDIVDINRIDEAVEIKQAEPVKQVEVIEKVDVVKQSELDKKFEEINLNMLSQTNFNTENIEIYDIKSVEPYIRDFCMTSFSKAYMRFKIEHPEEIDYPLLERKKLLDNSNFKFDIILEGKIREQFTTIKRFELRDHITPMFCNYDSSSTKIYALKDLKANLLLGEFIGDEVIIEKIKPNDVYYKLNNKVAVVRSEKYNIFGMARFSTVLALCNCRALTAIFKDKYPHILIVTIRDIKIGDEIIIKFDH